jgi:hypothetical protein
MLNSDQVIHHNKPVYYGEYPDPNDLKKPMGTSAIGKTKNLDELY